VKHEALEDDCVECHDPHGGSTKAMLIDAKNENLAPLCFNCHEEDIVAEEYKHGPAALGACNECHDPHASNRKRLLLSGGADLCAGCHEELAETIDAAEHVHDPADDDCTDCHDPHSGPHPFMLPAAKRALCNECHEEIVAKAEQSDFQHAPTTTEEECVGCHSPHASNAAPLLRKPQRELCLGCHDEPMKTERGWLKDMSSWLAEHEVWHKPVTEDDCSGCHRPHGSANFRLLKKPFPESFYTSFDKANYGLCFSCHEEALVTIRSTQSVTNFRDGQRNLHFLHVNRKKRGRSCRACHEVHASNHALHVRERVPFGRWMMPINFDKSAEGGSCAPGCHAPESYSRELQAEPNTALESKGSAAGEPAGSGG
jgi:predicted CXXCH cytochrome family protein